ncbi:MAG: nucleotidyltransferase family protein [Clostridia bacterium]|nr:nucleotidyltransferase family protein [Clostridia bacterium]
MDNKEAKILFALLRNGVFGEELFAEVKASVKPEVLPALYKLSKAHDLAHLVADALDKNGLLSKGESIAKAFLQERTMAVYRYEQSNYELEEVCRILEEEKIEHIPLKGSVLRKYYPEPWMRTSCDIDILVRQEQVKNIVDILTEKYGYTYAIHTQHDYSLYSVGGVHIELHFILIFHDTAGDDFTRRVWEKATNETGCLYKKKLPDDLFFTYHIAHMAQHILEGGGCGIKPFIDIQIMNKKMGISIDQVQIALEECGLTTFAKKVVELSNNWFVNVEEGNELKELEAYVLCGGVYGTLDNKIIVGSSTKKGKFHYILKRLFLPYRRLCLLYPSLKKCPILFPFYQVRRWFRLLRKNGVKVSGAVRELKSVSQVDSDTKERMGKMLQELGLK